MPWRQTGMIRPNITLIEEIMIEFKSGWQPPIEGVKVHEALKRGPALAVVAINDVFHVYKGGIDLGYACDFEKGHVMLLVGEGSDEDTEIPYWLFKNSYSSSWGEDGYYRLAKSSKCLFLVNVWDVEFPDIKSRGDFDRATSIRESQKANKVETSKKKKKRKKKEQEQV
ncbi:Cysteine proteinase, partial [Fragariocoptes setiger]